LFEICEFKNGQKREKEARKRKKNIKRGGPSGGAATHRGRPPRPATASHPISHRRREKIEREERR